MSLVNCKGSAPATWKQYSFFCDLIIPYVKKKKKKNQKKKIKETFYSGQAFCPFAHFTLGLSLTFQIALQPVVQANRSSKENKIMV